MFNYRQKFIGFNWKKVVKYSLNFESSEGYEIFFRIRALNDESADFKSTDRECLRVRG